jgi:hypothetical protein
MGLALVPDYRVYTLGEDGHIVRRTEIYCLADDAALERAKNLVDGHAVELWEGDRRTALIDGKDGSPTPSRCTLIRKRSRLGVFFNRALHRLLGVPRRDREGHELGSALQEVHTPAGLDDRAR